MQKTLKETVTIKGRGLHTGKDVIMKVDPAPPFFGRRFVRVDLEGFPEIKVCLENLSQTPLCTALVKDRAEILTIEHFMAACRALHLDNLSIEIDSSELPGLDGSALPFYDALKTGGIKDQVPKKTIEIEKPIFVRDKGAYIAALPAKDLRISYTFVSTQENIPDMYFEFAERENDFETDLAPARTIAFKEQLEFLRRQGLAQGGDESMVVLIDKTGFANKRRFQNEVSRHKVLDIYGDLALIGEYRLKAHIVAAKTGHRHNALLAKEILENAGSGLGDR